MKLCNKKHWNAAAAPCPAKKYRLHEAEMVLVLKRADLFEKANTVPVRFTPEQ